MEEKITWTNETRKLSELIPWPRNPRQIKTTSAKRLSESFDEFGQVEMIVIGPQNQLYNGHQRLNVLAAKYGKNYEVSVRVASRILTEDEREKLTFMLHSVATGSWNWDEISNWDAKKLIEWGVNDDLLKGWNSDAGSLREMLSANYEFKPNTSPVIGAIKVTDEDIAKEKDRLDNRFSEAAGYIEVTCPHCARDFFLNKRDIK